MSVMWIRLDDDADDDCEMSEHISFGCYSFNICLATPSIHQKDRIQMPSQYLNLDNNDEGKQTYNCE